MTDGTVTLFDQSQKKPQSLAQSLEGITVTPLAQMKVAEILEAEGKTGHGLRLAVTAGGCSGYNYGLYFEESANPEDQVFSTDGFDVFVDPRSYPVIAGTEIDFVDSLQGSGFKINNPNAMSMCGCGKSFTT